MEDEGQWIEKKMTRTKIRNQVRIRSGRWEGGGGGVKGKWRGKD